MLCAHPGHRSPCGLRELVVRLVRGKLLLVGRQLEEPAEIRLNFWKPDHDSDPLRPEGLPNLLEEKAKLMGPRLDLLFKSLLGTYGALDPTFRLRAPGFAGVGRTHRGRCRRPSRAGSPGPARRSGAPARDLWTEKAEAPMLRGSYRLSNVLRACRWF